jgi:hypothetical protein
MKRKKRKRTPEERAEWKARGEEQIRTLRGHADRIRAELAAKRREESA